MAYQIEFDVVYMFIQTGTKPDTIKASGTYISSEIEQDDAEAEVFEYSEADDKNLLSEAEADRIDKLYAEYVKDGATLIDSGVHIINVKEI